MASGKLKNSGEADPRPFAELLPALLPEDLPFQPPPEAISALGRYVDMLHEWNKAMNLVGKRDRKGIFIDLVRDSLYLAAFLKSLGKFLGDDPLVADPGAGAGLPGVPLRCVWQRGKYIMIELRQKRAIFLQNVLACLALPGTYSAQADAWEFMKRQPWGQGSLNCIVSRAFRPWPELLTLCRPFLKPGSLQIVLARDSAPKPISGWEVVDQCQYAAGDGKRWFWAFTPRDGNV